MNVAHTGLLRKDEPKPASATCKHMPALPCIELNWPKHESASHGRSERWLVTGGHRVILVEPDTNVVLSWGRVQLCFNDKVLLRRLQEQYGCYMDHISFVWLLNICGWLMRRRSPGTKWGDCVRECHARLRIL